MRPVNSVRVAVAHQSQDQELEPKGQGTKDHIFVLNVFKDNQGSRPKTTSLSGALLMTQQLTICFLSCLIVGLHIVSSVCVVLNSLRL